MPVMGTRCVLELLDQFAQLLITGNRAAERNSEDISLVPVRGFDKEAAIVRQALSDIVNSWLSMPLPQSDCYLIEGNFIHQLVGRHLANGVRKPCSGTVLEPRHLDRRLPICVASTGLPYLVIPVTGEGLARARIAEGDLERRLASVGAKFAYLLDVEEREGRTWDNAGAVEDIATGSAAGPVGGLLVRYGLAERRQSIVLRQGRFVGRPSEMRVEVCEARGQNEGDVILSGSVVTVAQGTFDADVVDRPVDA